ncbi:30S ribosomal protein S7 [Candidatus Woesearchaeota archaeon]|nr:30S ribosomal protein S7 [Candidatus Woesearchaeota archaeon]
MDDIKIFNKWSTEGIVVGDMGLQRYVTLKPRIVPKTSGRHIGTMFRKSKLTIVERFINKIMIPGHKSKKHKLTSGTKTGKGNKAFQIALDSFRLIEQRLKKNPVEVLVGAVENASQREEIITIEYGGARYPKAVECSPQRRIDLALRLMTQGAFQKSFNSKKRIQECLADEIIWAYSSDAKSNAISKKLEVERQADGAR